MGVPSILIVDDDASTSHGLSSYLRARGFRVDAFVDYESAKQGFSRSTDALVLSDELPDEGAIRLLTLAKSLNERMIVIVMGCASVARTMRAVRLGADAFLSQPVTYAGVHDQLSTRLMRKRTSPTMKAVATSTFFEGADGSMKQLKGHVTRIIGADCSVLLFGEAGTGKLRLARFIHDEGVRSKEAFVEVSCVGLTPDLLDSGNRSAKGLLELAHKGTLVLLGLHAVDPTVQTALLDAIEHTPFDVRLISTTREQPAADHHLRRDLYYRLGTVTLRVPPLRDRPSEVLQLARRLIAAIAAETGGTLSAITAEAETMLVNYAWPGNVRELKDVLTRALARASEGMLTADDLVLGERPTVGPRPRLRIDVTR